MAVQKIAFRSLLKWTYLRSIAVAMLTASWVVTPVLAQNGVVLSYLGTAGWEISDGKIVILVDPYISRLKHTTPNDAKKRPPSLGRWFAMSHHVFRHRRFCDLDTQLQ